MFVVQSDGALDRIVAQCVAVGEIFGDDPRAGLVFLGDFGGVVGFVLGGRGGAKVGEVGCAGDTDLGLAELGVVEEESGFGGTGGRIGLA